ncbi:MAG: beta-ketoacyl synthase N-terminal-like domain-containing protein [Rhodospirillaceae bacterium]
MNGERSQSGIAIVGIACRLPGATDYRRYWQNLCQGIESVTEFTDAELLAAGIDPAVVRDPDYVKSGFIVPGIDRFDAAFFEYSPTEARVIDPQQRLMHAYRVNAHTH